MVAVWYCAVLCDPLKKREDVDSTSRWSNWPLPSIGVWNLYTQYPGWILLERPKDPLCLWKDILNFLTPCCTPLEANLSYTFEHTRESLHPTIVWRPSYRLVSAELPHKIANNKFWKWMFSWTFACKMTQTCKEQPGGRKKFAKRRCGADWVIFLLV
jgi:hypothetical protein